MIPRLLAMAYDWNRISINVSTTSRTISPINTSNLFPGLAHSPLLEAVLVQVISTRSTTPYNVLCFRLEFGKADWASTISESVCLFRGRQMSPETRLTSKYFQDVSQDSESDQNREFLTEYITYSHPRLLYDCRRKSQTSRTIRVRGHQQIFHVAP